MKTLEEHNKEQMVIFESLQKLPEPHRNGIACPECGEELWDSTPMIILVSYPPKKKIHCPACGYCGYRIA
jgi:DNA-directed RNA polymerase subunit RPC12/RpoP